MHQSTPNTCQIHPQTTCSRLVVSPRRQPELMSRKPQFSQKYTEILVLGRGGHPCPNPPKPKIQKISYHVTPVSVDENQLHTSSDYQILPNYAWSNSRANGGVWGGWEVLVCRPPTPISFGNFQNQRDARTYENQGTPSPSLALECKCAFGAKIPSSS